MSRILQTLLPGFQPIGYLAPGRHAADHEVDTGSYTGRHRAQPDDDVIKAEQKTKRRMKFRIKLDSLPPEMIAELFGPQMAVYMAFRQINPHWYLGGDA